MKRFLVLFLALAGSLSAQQPQSSTAPDYGASTRCVQGSSLGGYRPSAGSGLTLTLGPRDGMVHGRDRSTLATAKW